MDQHSFSRTNKLSQRSQRTTSLTPKIARTRPEEISKGPPTPNSDNITNQGHEIFNKFRRSFEYQVPKFHELSRAVTISPSKHAGKIRNTWLTATLLSRYIGGNSLQIVSHTILQRDHEAFSQQSWFFLNEGETTSVEQKSLQEDRKNRREEETRAGRELPYSRFHSGVAKYQRCPPKSLAWYMA